VSPWNLFFAALGLAMFLEGLPYFISPGGVRRWVEQLSGMGDGALRMLGLALMACGLLVVWAALGR